MQGHVPRTVGAIFSGRVRNGIFFLAQPAMWIFPKIGVFTSQNLDGL